MRRFLSFLAIVAVCFSVTAREAVKREMRGVWLATTSNIDWPQGRGTGPDVVARHQQQLTDLIDGYSRANMNCIYFQARPMADALYRSSYEPWSVNLTGKRGLDPGWDPLEYAVRECHKRGIECYAWVNPYRFSNKGGKDNTTPYDQELKQMGVLMQCGDYVVFNPALEWTRNHILDVCREIITSYDVDGLIFDDYFYPGGGTPEDATAPDYQLWLDSGSPLGLADWRRDNVNLMVRQVYDMVHSTRPYVKFAISPAGVCATDKTSAPLHGVDPCPVGGDWQYNAIYSDPLQWMEEGTIDYISPQVYSFMSTPDKPFGRLDNWWSYISGHYGIPHYSGMGVYRIAETNNEEDWREIHTQIECTRRQSPPGESGVVFFSARYLYGPGCTGLGDYLAANTFTHKAIQPELPGKPVSDPGVVGNLHFNGVRLSWTPVDMHLARYAVYAIPMSVSADEACNSLYGGINGDYLVGVTYGSAYDVPQQYHDGFYWFAVTVVDGWGHEFAPATIGAPGAAGAAVQPVSPVNGATAAVNQTFTWTALPDATYRLEVARDSVFSSLVASRMIIAGTQTDVDLSAVEGGTTCYWRVFALQPGLRAVPSPIASFVAGQRPVAAAATLTAPARGSRLDNDFSFVFSPNGASKYELQVADSPDFSHMLWHASGFAVDNLDKTLYVKVLRLGKGRRYWRVMTHADGHDSAASGTWSFDVASLPVGSCEAGYVMKRDVDSYEPKGQLSITNDWLRSVKDVYANYSCEGDGYFNRDFTVNDGCIYVVGREAAASDAPVYLDIYSVYTGERIRRLNVSRYVQARLYPGNNVMTDNAGNLLISNLVTDIGKNDLTLHEVDVETGFVTERARISDSAKSGMRIDNCAVYGDVTSGTFYVFAAISNGTQVIRWTVADGAVTQTLVMNASAYYPARATTWSTAPRVFPMSEDKVVVKGVGNYATLYDINTGNILDSFAGNAAITPSSTGTNGYSQAMVDGVRYAVYPYSDHRNSEGHRFMLAAGAGECNFKQLSPLWTLPAQGLGNVKNGAWDALCHIEPATRSREAKLYLYVPGNGLAAYTLHDSTPLAGDVNGDGTIDITDVNALVNVVLSRIAPSAYGGRADVTGDGTIDVSDINAVIKLILH